MNFKILCILVLFIREYNAGVVPLSFKKDNDIPKKEVSSSLENVGSSAFNSTLQNSTFKSITNVSAEPNVQPNVSAETIAKNEPSHSAKAKLVDKNAKPSRSQKDPEKSKVTTSLLSASKNPTKNESITLQDKSSLSANASPTKNVSTNLKDHGSLQSANTTLNRNKSTRLKGHNRLHFADHRPTKTEMTRLKHSSLHSANHRPIESSKLKDKGLSSNSRLAKPLTAGVATTVKPVTPKRNASKADDKLKSLSSTQNSSQLEIAQNLTVLNKLSPTLKIAKFNGSETTQNPTKLNISGNAPNTSLNNAGAVQNHTVSGKLVNAQNQTIVAQTSNLTSDVSSDLNAKLSNRSSVKASILPPSALNGSNVSNEKHVNKIGIGSSDNSKLDTSKTRSTSISSKTPKPKSNKKNRTSVAVKASNNISFEKRLNSTAAEEVSNAQNPVMSKNTSSTNSLSNFTVHVTEKSGNSTNSIDETKASTVMGVSNVTAITNTEIDKNSSPVKSSVAELSSKTNSSKVELQSNVTNLETNSIKDTLNTSLPTNALINKEEEIDSGNKSIASDGIFSSAGIEYLMNSEVAKNAALALEVFNFSDAMSDHIIEESGALGILDTSNVNHILNDISHDPTAFRNATANNATALSSNTTSMAATMVEMSAMNGSLDNGKATDGAIDSLEQATSLDAVNHSDILVNNTTNSQNPLCPPPGWCLFPLFSQDDTCAVDSHCLGSSICCRIRCSKTCVDI